MAEVEQLSFALTVQRTKIIDGVVQPSTEVNDNHVEAQVETGYQCPECDAVSTEVKEGPVYECIECEKKFTRDEGVGRYGTMCPDCGNKPGRKVDGQLCAACEEGVVDEIEVVTCPMCEEAIVADDWPQHMLDEHVTDLYNGG